MPEGQTMEFYAEKSGDLPRFAYRRLAKAIQDHPEQRAQAIEATLAELQGASHPELRKFKFILPAYLREVLTSAEAAQMDEALAKLRDRAAKLKMVFPPASDEFSVSHEFLQSVFNLDGGPVLPSGAQIYTVGSCFARNIAVFLTANGRRASTYALSEDLNSPMSNAFLFDMVRQPTEARAERMTYWLGRMFPELDEAQLAQVAELKLRSIGQLERGLAGADCVVLTLGNVVDFFAEEDTAAPITQKVLPKFVAMAAQGDTGVDSKAVARLKRAGAVLRMGTHQETKEAIACCIAGIRAVTSAPVVVTLSPVPVDALIGLSGPAPQSAVEIDCVSKSRLRSALDELWPSLVDPAKPLFYFPSFEIVRWIAPLMNIPAFGREDAASRHVSAPILQSICSLFADKFVRADRATAVSQPEASAASQAASAGAAELLVPTVKAPQQMTPLSQRTTPPAAGPASELEAALVYGVANARTRTFPYPHIYVPEIFPPEFYAQLQRNIPDPSAMAPIGEVRPVTGYDERFVLHLNDPTDRLPQGQKAFWGELGAKLLAGRFRKALLRKFHAELAVRFGEGRELKVFDEAMLVEDITNYALGPHTDARAKVITVLFYLPPDDRQRHLGTSIYTPKDPTRRCEGGPHHEREDFNRVATMPFLPNSMFAFPKTDNAFHGVERVTDPDVRRWLLLYDIRLRGG